MVKFDIYPKKTALLISDVEIYDEIERQEDDIVVVKRVFSAFFGTDLDLILRISEIDTMIIAGLAAHSSCEATARDARHRNYRVIFLSDGTATYDHFRDMGWGGQFQVMRSKGLF